MEDLIGDLTAVPQPIEVKLFGDDPAQLEQAAQKVADGISGISGVVEVNNGLRVSGDAITITVDRGAAAIAGLDPAASLRKSAPQVDGASRRIFSRANRQSTFACALRKSCGGALIFLAALPLRSADGRATTLGAIARIGIQAGQRQLTREDLAPFIPVTARLEGKDLGTGIRDVQAKVKSLGLPSSDPR